MENTTLTDKQKELIEKNKWDEDAVIAYIKLGIGDDNLFNFEEAYQGEWPNDKEFAQDMAEQTGLLPKEMHWPLYCIDWDYAARDLMIDYSEQDGYYFTNL